MDAEILCLESAFFIAIMRPEILISPDISPNRTTHMHSGYLAAVATERERQYSGVVHHHHQMIYY
jgi:hypothetical protein